MTAFPIPSRRSPRPARARRIGATLVGASIVLGLFGPATTPPAGAAQEASLRPASGVFTVEGRGFGHGRGMSQWGAYGAADSGRSWRQILDFYYPGTFRHETSDSTIRVWISADDDGATTVLPSSGLSVTFGASRRPLPSGAGYRAWRASGSGTALTLHFLDAAGTWRPYAVPTTADLAFEAGSGVVRVALPGGTTQELRGVVHAVRDGSRVRTVLHSTMESYLRSVVPAEMPASWHTQALAAQSVAARTYAASYRARQRAKGATYDICDSQACQVFVGIARTSASGRRTVREEIRSDAAIALTRGTVLRTSASVASSFVFAEFSASNGGYTAAGGPFYQVAKVDPYDGRLANPSTSWSRPVTAAAFERAFPVGSLRAVRIARRDGLGALGGRVRTLVLDGSRGSVTVTGSQLRLALGLKSDWFAVSSPGLAAPVVAPPAPRPGPRPAATTPRPTPAIQPGGTFRDLDSDGRPDIVAVEADGSLWLRNLGPRGVLADARRIGVDWRRMDALVSAGQFDGSGGEDIIAREARTGRLLLYPGDGTGRLGRPRVIGIGWGSVTSVSAVGDVDGDRHPDLVALQPGRRQLVLLPGRSGGGLGPSRVIGRGWVVSSVAGVGDATGDGRRDIVAVATSTGQLGLYAGTGKGTFTTRTGLGRGWSTMRSISSAGDVTSDRRPDLLAHDRSGRVLVYPGTGSRYGAARVVGTGVAPVLTAR